jgi:hypothetical protein
MRHRVGGARERCSAEVLCEDVVNPEVGGVADPCPAQQSHGGFPFVRNDQFLGQPLERCRLLLGRVDGDRQTAQRVRIPLSHRVSQSGTPRVGIERAGEAVEALPVCVPQDASVAGPLVEMDGQLDLALEVV